jgi:hypothetical protein
MDGRTAGNQQSESGSSKAAKFSDGAAHTFLQWCLSSPALIASLPTSIPPTPREQQHKEED